MRRLNKQVFITLLSFSKSVGLRYLIVQNVYLNNQPCMNRPILIGLSPDEHNQGLRHYLFMIKLDRFNGRCNTLEDFPSRICALGKTEDVNINAFNLITETYE